MFGARAVSASTGMSDRTSHFLIRPSARLSSPFVIATSPTLWVLSAPSAPNDKREPVLQRRHLRALTAHERGPSSKDDQPGGEQADLPAAAQLGGRADGAGVNEHDEARVVDEVREHGGDDGVGLERDERKRDAEQARGYDAPEVDVEEAEERPREDRGGQARQLGGEAAQDD